MTWSVELDPTAHTLTLASRDIYLTIRVRVHDLMGLTRIAETDWEQRRTLPIGMVLGSQVFWCRSKERGEVAVLVGSDEEAWDLAVSLPRSIVGDIVARAQQSLR